MSTTPCGHSPRKSGSIPSFPTVGAPLAPRVALLAPAGIALLAGLDAALMLLGLPAPVRVDRLPEVHGMLMVLGFVGTLLALTGWLAAHDVACRTIHTVGLPRHMAGCRGRVDDPRQPGPSVSGPS